MHLAIITCITNQNMRVVLDSALAVLAHATISARRCCCSCGDDDQYFRNVCTRAMGLMLLLE